MKFHYKITAEARPVGYGSYFYTLWNETICIQMEESVGSYLQLHTTVLRCPWKISAVTPNTQQKKLHLADMAPSPSLLHLLAFRWWSLLNLEANRKEAEKSTGNTPSGKKSLREEQLKSAKITKPLERQFGPDTKGHIFKAFTWLNLAFVSKVD